MSGLPSFLIVGAMRSGTTSLARYLAPHPDVYFSPVPDAKLVAILRDSVERAYSHYWHERALRRERLGFPEAIAAEPERLRSPDAVARAGAAYLDRGTRASSSGSPSTTHGKRST